MICPRTCGVCLCCHSRCGLGPTLWSSLNDLNYYKLDFSEILYLHGLQTMTPSNFGNDHMPPADHNIDMHYLGWNASTTASLVQLFKSTSWWIIISSVILSFSSSATIRSKWFGLWLKFHKINGPCLPPLFVVLFIGANKQMLACWDILNIANIIAAKHLAHVHPYRVARMTKDISLVPTFLHFCNRYNFVLKKSKKGAQCRDIMYHIMISLLKVELSFCGLYH